MSKRSRLSCVLQEQQLNFTKPEPPEQTKVKGSDHSWMSAKFAPECSESSIKKTRNKKLTGSHLHGIVPIASAARSICCDAPAGFNLIVTKRAGLQLDRLLNALNSSAKSSFSPHFISFHSGSLHFTSFHSISFRFIRWSLIH